MVPRKQKISKLVYQHLLWWPEYKLTCHCNSSTLHPYSMLRPDWLISSYLARANATGDTLMPIDDTFIVWLKGIDRKSIHPVIQMNMKTLHSYSYIGKMMLIIANIFSEVNLFTKAPKFSMISKAPGWIIHILVCLCK